MRISEILVSVRELLSGCVNLFVHQGVDSTNYQLEVHGYRKGILSMRMDEKIPQTQSSTAGQTWIPVGPQ